MDRSVPAGAALLLDFVYRTDAGKAPPACYSVIFGNRQKHLANPITQMTIGGLIDAQKNWSSKGWVKRNWSSSYNAASSAAGAAQFMRDTLISLSKELGLCGNQLFDANLQDRLAYHLLIRRGYHEFMSGKIRRTEFGKRLAQEWASFPVLAATKGAHRQLKRGQSYYAGDGVNKALVSPAKIEAVLNQVKAAGAGQLLATVIESEPEAIVIKEPVVADPGELGTPPAKSKIVITNVLTGACTSTGLHSAVASEKAVSGPYVAQT